MSSVTTSHYAVLLFRLSLALKGVIDVGCTGAVWGYTGMRRKCVTTAALFWSPLPPVTPLRRLWNLQTHHILTALATASTAEGAAKTAFNGAPAQKPQLPPLPNHFRCKNPSSALMGPQLKVAFCLCLKSVSLNGIIKEETPQTERTTVISLHKWHFMAVFLSSAKRGWGKRTTPTATDKCCSSECVREKPLIHTIFSSSSVVHRPVCVIGSTLAFMCVCGVKIHRLLLSAGLNHHQAAGPTAVRSPKHPLQHLLPLTHRYEKQDY